MSQSMFATRDWRNTPRRALNPTEIVSALAQLDGWVLTGEATAVAIEKHYHFGNYFETMVFVNALAWIAHTQDHHPDLAVHYNRCVVRFSTHDVNGISASDIDCARRCDALLKPD